MTDRLVTGDRAPAFTLPDGDGTPVALSSYLGRRVLLFAYPAAMTPGCTKEACDFRDAGAVLSDSGYTVLGISPDTPAKQAAFRTAYALPYPLLADTDKAVLTAYGAYGEKSLYGKTVTGVIRSTFVIGPDGLIEHAFYNIKATGHVAKLQRDLAISS